jgi:hypothetical protein
VRVQQRLRIAQCQHVLNERSTTITDAISHQWQFLFFLLTVSRFLLDANRLSLIPPPAIVLLAMLDPHMFRQGTRMSISFLAHRAFKRPTIRLHLANATMRDQRGRVDEASHTSGTFEWSLAGVDACVDAQFRRGRECRWTLRTRKRLRICICKTRGIIHKDDR